MSSRSVRLQDMKKALEACIGRMLEIRHWMVRKLRVQRNMCREGCGHLREACGVGLGHCWLGGERACGRVKARAAHGQPPRCLARGKGPNEAGCGGLLRAMAAMKRRYGWHKTAGPTRISTVCNHLSSSMYTLQAWVLTRAVRVRLCACRPS